MVRSINLQPEHSLLIFGGEAFFPFLSLQAECKLLWNTCIVICHGAEVGRECLAASKWRTVIDPDFTLTTWTLEAFTLPPEFQRSYTRQIVAVQPLPKWRDRVWAVSTLSFFFHFISMYRFLGQHSQFFSRVNDKREIWGLDGNCKLRFLGHCKIVFQSECIILHFHQQYMRNAVTLWLH